ncbi:MAG: hypothetical protein JXN59_16315, partial [Anaerolineae bacterium]|nr:hypothetical protein [Anaerolineae bacterium]
IPTAPVSPTVTATPPTTATPLPRATEPPTATPRRAAVTGGPSPTSIVGPTRTPRPDISTPTPRPNPNAPRIEYFRGDPAYVFPGDSLTLFWSIRGADRAAIYKLDAQGQRSQLWNVEPAGSLVVPTRRSDRGLASYLLTVDNGEFYVEQLLEVPLLCAYEWFFAPAPVACPAARVTESTHIEQLFEGGRMIYVAEQDRVYVLFADGLAPAWTSFPNRYVGGEMPEEDTNFIPPPGRFQPIRILGLVWRGSDPVRNRLALGIAPEVTYEGAYQVDTGLDGNDTLFLRGADGSVLKLDPNGASWSVVGAS